MDKMKRSGESAPIRILNTLTDALAQLKSVRRVVSFGSVASGRCDQWSDIDLIVVCADESACWRYVAVIREILPVLFYRKFSSKEQPSGRYWFRDELPMNRLDISFETEDSYRDIHASSTTDGHKRALRDEYISRCHSQPEEKIIVNPWEKISVSPEETEIGRCLYLALESIKFVLRGNFNWKWDRKECVEKLEEALRKSSQLEFAGGDLRTLANRCYEMNEYAERILEPKS